MVEVFRTDLDSTVQAKELLGIIRRQWPDYLVNFDLEDCDRVLRVEIESGSIEQEGLILLMRAQGRFCERLN